MTICISKLTIIGSDNGLSPVRRQAIFWTNARVLLIGPLGTNLSEVVIEIHTFSFKKIDLKISSGKWRPFCLSFNVLNMLLFSVEHADSISILWLGCCLCPIRCGWQHQTTLNTCPRCICVAAWKTFTFWWIFVVTLMLNFQGQILHLLYLSKKWFHSHEMKSKHIDQTQGPEIWPSILTLAMTLSETFQGKMFDLLYLRTKLSYCHETTNEHIKLNARPQVWPSVLTQVMILNLDFQGQILK